MDYICDDVLKLIFTYCDVETIHKITKDNENMLKYMCKYPKTIAIPEKHKSRKCWHCKKHVFAVTTPSGADYYTCPLCGNGCSCCGILFSTSCTHS